VAELGICLMGPVTRKDLNQVHDVHEHSLQYLTVVLIRCFYFLPELVQYVHTYIH
jgi:hypothetical protein